MENESSPIITQVNRLPSLPGCYLYRNRFDTIIYIGKSKSLRQRVKQYFTGMDQKAGKIALLVNEVVKIDHIVTDSELDAILLECRLIKQYLPKYNTMLKKTPNFVYLKIDLEKKYPNISVVMERMSDKHVKSDKYVISDKHSIANRTKVTNCYFGLFYSENEAKEAVAILNRVFHTPVCVGGFEKNKKPCFYFYLNKCYGPCSQMISAEEYKKLMIDMVSFLQGKSKAILKDLYRKMVSASAELEFEKAAALRDSYQSLIRLQNKSNRLHLNLELKNLIVFLRPFYQSRITILLIRENKVRHRIDYESEQEFTMESLIKFTSEAVNDDFNQAESEWQIQHILEVYCDKYFLPLYKKSSPEMMAKKLLRAAVHIHPKEFEQKS